MVFTIGNTSPRASENMVRSLRQLADGIERGTIEYKSGGIVIGQDDDGIYVQSDLRMVLSETWREKV